MLVSHLHHDHADLASLRLVRDAVVLTGPANARWVARRTGAVGPDLGDGGWHRVGGPVDDSAGLDVRLVRADHGARPMPHRPNESHGHLLRAAGGVVWFAGDTSLHSEMEALPELAGRPIDLALVPIGGWGPRLSPGHLGPAEAVEACRRVRPRAVLPIHYGTLYPPGFAARGLAWLHRPLVDFRRLLAQDCPATRLLEASPGQSVEVA